MSRPVRLALASLLYTAGMYGVYRAAVWGYSQIGLWVLAVTFVIGFPIALLIDRADRRSQRPG